MSEKQEIEITSEMIETGVRHLWESGRLRNEAYGPDRLLIAELLHACLKTARDAPAQVVIKNCVFEKTE